MTTLRRILAVFLILLLIPVFLVALLVAQVNATVLSPDFYVSQLRQADIFNFVYDKALPAALDETEADLPESIQQKKPKIIAVIKKAFPPEWLEQQSEVVIVQIVPYVTGEKDEFLVPLKEPVQRAGLGLKDLTSDPDVYALIVDETIAPELAKMVEDQGALPFGVKVTGADLVAAFKDVAPQQWVASAVGQSVDQAVPFATGESDSFTIIIPVRDRIEAAGPALKRLLASSGAYSLAESPEFTQMVQEQLDGLGVQPFGLTLTGEQVASVLRQVITPEWTQRQADAAIDQVVPYLAGTSDSVAIVVPLKDRLLAAQPGFKKLLNDSGAYRKVGDEFVEIIVAKNVSGAVTLPLGVSVTSEEMTRTLRQALSDDFLRQQSDALIDAFIPYIAGETQSLRLVIQLAPVKARVLTEVETLVTQKARVAWDGLPRCTFNQTVTLVRQAAVTAIPSCRPAGFTLQEMKQALGINDPNVTENDIARQLGVDVTLLTKGVTFDWLLEKFGTNLRSQVNAQVGAALPDQFVYTDADLETTLSPDGVAALDKIREWSQTGYTWTEADLQGMLGGGDSTTLDDLRSWAKDGFRYSNADLEKTLAEGGPEGLKTYRAFLGFARNGFSQADLAEAMGDSGSSADFEDIRQGMKTFRTYHWVAYLVPLLLLLGVAFLGGKGLRGRLAWGSAGLAVAAFVAVALFGVVYSAVVWPQIADMMAQQTAQASGVELLAMQKGFEIAGSISEAIVGGMAWKAGIVLVLAIAGIVVAAFLPRIKKALAKRESPPAKAAQG